MITVSAFTTPEDIANRALQHVGADHKIVSLLNDGTKPQREILSVYSKLRQAELRRAAWQFAIRYAVLRPIDVTTYQWTPPAWANNVTYRVGAVVSYDDGYGLRYWQNQIPANLNNVPGSGTAWRSYAGTLFAVPYDSSEAYFTGDLVYVAGTGGSAQVYLSTQQINKNSPSTPQLWNSTQTYEKEDIVTDGVNTYVSLIDFNLNNTPATSPSAWAITSLALGPAWVLLGGTLTRYELLYPMTAGPASQTITRNVYPLPYGFLRMARQEPKSGSTSIFGAPTNRAYDDWLIESGMLVTRDSEPIILRFVADEQNVSYMDPMFWEGLACRIAMEIVEALTQSTEKARETSASYTVFMREARLVNAIEEGADEPAMDDWIQTRI